MNAPEVVCVGNAAVDVPLAPVDKEILVTDSYVVDRIVPMVGGSSINVSTILSRLGKNVKLITLLGVDMLGKFVLDHCRSNNIDISDVSYSRGVDTPLSIGLVKSDGERNFVVSRSSSTFSFNIADVNLASLKGAKALVFSSIFIMPEFDDNGLTKLFRVAKNEGLIVCADMMRSRTGQRLDAIRNALLYVDFYFANYEEAAFLTEMQDVSDIANCLLGVGVKTVVIKLGKNGCYVKGNGFAFRSPAFLNENPVDTIGAGDNFVAGFIAALLDKLDMVEAARFANAVAALSVSSIGSTSAIKNKQQVLQFMKESSTH